MDEMKDVHAALEEYRKYILQIREQQQRLFLKEKMAFHKLQKVLNYGIVPTVISPKIKFFDRIWEWIKDLNPVQRQD